MIVWGERIGADASAALLQIAGALGLADRAGAGLLEIPAGANGRGLREAGVLPDAGPGYAELEDPGRAAAEIAQAAADGAITALYLLQADPVRDYPNRALWEAALHRAGLVVAHASVLTEGLKEHANVIFPAESHAEKDGTVVHPDGRIQRLRTAIAHPGSVRAGWSVIAEIARRAGLDTGVLTSPMAFGQLVDAVPFYKGITLEEIGGHGVRWPDRAKSAGADAKSAGADSVARLPPHDCGARRPSRPGLAHPNPLRTEPCDWGPTGRSGPRRRSRHLPRFTTRSPTSNSSSRPTTRCAWASPRARPSRWHRMGHA